MHYLLTLILLLTATHAIAADAVVETSSLEAVEVHGVNLGMSDEGAFSILSAAGHRAGPIKNFEDWTGEGLEMVRGNNQGPEGESRLLLVRRDGKVIQLSETFIRTRGERFDPETEIGELQQTLGIPANHPSCHVTRSGGGICEVQDHADPNQAQTSLTFSVTPIMIQRVLLRREALHPAKANN